MTKNKTETFDYNYYIHKYNIDREREAEWDMPAHHVYQINPKEVEIDEIVYFIYDNKKIYFGIVDKHYADCICLKIYSLKETRYIDDVPYKDVPSCGKWRKLPKGWTYDTELFQLTTKINDDEKAMIDLLRISDKQALRQAIEKGILVPSESLDWSYIEAEIDSKRGYRLVKKYPNDYGLSSIERIKMCGYSCVKFTDVYMTFDEAQKVVDDWKSGLEKIAAMSDEEYYFRDILQSVEKAMGLKYWGKDIVEYEEAVETYMNYFINLGIESIEVRNRGYNLEWKYTKNKKWLNVCLD